MCIAGLESTQYGTQFLQTPRVHTCQAHAHSCDTVAAPPATGVTTTRVRKVVRSTHHPNAHWPLQFACTPCTNVRFHLPLRRSCTRASTSARSAVLLLQQIREQLGVTQLRDVAHSLRRGEGGRVRVWQTALLSRRNAAHACKRCSSRRSLSVQTTTSGERGAVVGSVSTCSRAHAVKSCPPLSPRAGPHASRPWRRPPRARSHSRAQRRGTAETRRPAAPRPSR